MMKVTRKSMFTGRTRTLEMDVTQKQLDRWQKGELIQSVFPHLSISQREFLMTGAWDSEWDDHVGESEFEGIPLEPFELDDEGFIKGSTDKETYPVPQRTGTNIEDIPKDVADLMTSTMSLVAERMKEK